MEMAERSYLALLADGATPQEARSVLPNSLKTEIVVTFNLRQWRHFFKLRALGTTGSPHPQMLEISLPLLSELRHHLPAVFGDL
jgi:thymidylate synthase (FAD)